MLQVHSEVPGVCHGVGLYPVGVAKTPQILLRSCRIYNGCCKRKLNASEVLSLYDISDTVDLSLTQYLCSKVIGVKHLPPVKIIVVYII
jgi:hypothetical protein